MKLKEKNMAASNRNFGVVFFIFFTVLTPIGFILRLIGKDLLRLKKKTNKNTYWIKKIDYKTSMNKQF